MTSTHGDTPRVPKALQPSVEQICALTDSFCADHLDGEYAQLCRGLVAKLARKRPSPLLRGDLRIWAAAAIHAVGSINFLFDRSQTPHLTVDQLCAFTGVAKGTMANKARLIRETLKTGQYDPEFCRRALLEHHPYAWLIELDGLIVDARALPAHLQAAARQRGLIPDLHQV
jgi:hypothetical protein